MTSSRGGGSRSQSGGPSTDDVTVAALAALAWKEGGGLCLQTP